MNSLLKKRISPIVWILLMSLTLFSCKKETLDREIDAFGNLGNRIEYEDGQYILHFRLAKFEYKQVSVRLADRLSSFDPVASSGRIYNVIEADEYMYSVYFDPLDKNKTYFYQITVQDQQDNSVFSDVYNFKTQ